MQTKTRSEPTGSLTRAPISGPIRRDDSVAVGHVPPPQPRNPVRILPPTRLRLIPATAPIEADEVVDGRIAVLVAARARALTEVRLEAERWTNEGGSYQADAAVPRRAAVRR
jgi:hypothetical protein